MLFDLDFFSIEGKSSGSIVISLSSDTLLSLSSDTLLSLSSDTLLSLSLNPSSLVSMSFSVFLIKSSSETWVFSLESSFEESELLSA